MGVCSNSIMEIVTARPSYRGGHGVPDPRFRTMAEWQALLPKMDSLIREKGLPPLTEPERETIIRYLNRHANS
jgi:hypothetical protein